SLIIGMVRSELAVSGRIWWRDAWQVVGRFAIERTPVRTWVGGNRPLTTPPSSPRVARLAGAFGEEASARLRRSTAAVLGARGRTAWLHRPTTQPTRHQRPSASLPRPSH